MSDGIAWAYEQREAAEARQVKPYEVYVVKAGWTESHYTIKKVLTVWHPSDLHYEAASGSEVFLTKEEAIEWIKTRLVNQIKELKKTLKQWSEESIT